MNTLYSPGQAHTCPRFEFICTLSTRQLYLFSRWIWKNTKDCVKSVEKTLLIVPPGGDVSCSTFFLLFYAQLCYGGCLCTVYFHVCREKKSQRLFICLFSGNSRTESLFAAHCMTQEWFPIWYFSKMQTHPNFSCSKPGEFPVCWFKKTTKKKKQKQTYHFISISLYCKVAELKKLKKM